MREWYHTMGALVKAGRNEHAGMPPPVYFPVHTTEAPSRGPRRRIGQEQ